VILSCPWEVVGIAFLTGVVSTSLLFIWLERRERR